MEGEVKGKTFKMKGHTLPGINQRSEGNTDLPDGRSKSSTFQFVGIGGTAQAKLNPRDSQRGGRMPGSGMPGGGGRPGLRPGGGGGGGSWWQKLGASMLPRS